MQLQNIIQKDYTANQIYYQFKLPLNIDCIIPEDDSVRLLSQFVEGMDLNDLYATYSRIKENQATPRQLLKVMIYGYMNHRYSSREIESSCRRDINFMFLLEGTPAPDHATIARFRSLHFAQCSERLLAEITNILYEIGEISGKDLFIDGTKIEAASNKYTFVWKKAVTKNMEKLLQKMADLVASCEEKYGIRVIYDGKVRMRHMKRLRKKLYALKEKEGIEFVHGTGKRKSELQKSMETLEEYLDRLKKYTQQVHICGSGNSYSKTDHDATFMRMKEDAMGNGQLKPAYNLQHGVDSEYITWLTVGPQPTDTTTLIPFLESMEPYLNFKYQNIVADAGYESEENYLFLEKNGQTAFIKTTNYEKAKTRKYKNDIGIPENMDYDPEEDVYTCHNGKKLKVKAVRHQKSKTGHVSEKTIYSCEDCSGCPYKTKCIRGNNCKTPMEDRTKNIQVSKVFKEKREQDLERITSEQGCQLRMNRSIQAEGSFGEVKADMSFRRYLCTGKRNVQAESILLAMAHNMNKLHHKIQGERTGTHLYDLKKSS